MKKTLTPARRLTAFLAVLLLAAAALGAQVRAVPGLSAATVLQAASGTVVDAVSDAETVVPGESFGAAGRVFLSAPSVAKIDAVTLRLPEGWLAEPAKPTPGTLALGAFAETADPTEGFRVSVPAEAEPTQPYWLKAPRSGQLYAWPAGAPAGHPFEAPLVGAEVRADIGGVSVVLTRPLQSRIVDPVRGERRRNVEVVPAVTLSLDNPLEIIPLAARGVSRSVTVRLQGNSQGEVSGSVRLLAPPGWAVSPESRVHSRCTVAGSGASPSSASLPTPRPRSARTCCAPLRRRGGETSIGRCA